MDRKNVEGGVICGNLFFTVGCCNFGDTLEEEIRKNLDEMGGWLKNLGLSFRDVVKATVEVRYPAGLGRIGRVELVTIIYRGND